MARPSAGDAPYVPGVNLVRLLWIGTVLWAVGFIALLPFMDQLGEEGRTWWLWACLSGVGIGLVGVEWARRAARHQWTNPRS